MSSLARRGGPARRAAGVPTGGVAPRVNAEAVQEAHRSDYVNDVGTLDVETVSHEAAYRVAPALEPCTAPRAAPPRPRGRALRLRRRRGS